MTRPIVFVLSMGFATIVCGDDLSYAGRSLDEWTELFAVAQGPSRTSASEAIALIAGRSAGGPQDNIYFAELVKLLSDDDSAVRCWGIRGMRIFGEKLAASDGGQTAALNTLEPYLKDDAPEPRIEAARAILLLGGAAAPAEAVLRAGVADRRAAVRKLAVTAIVELGPRAAGAKPALKAALADISPEIRELARRGLAPQE